jgi:TPR repeat protein
MKLNASSNAKPFFTIILLLGLTITTSGCAKFNDALQQLKHSLTPKQQKLQQRQKYQNQQQPLQTSSRQMEDREHRGYQCDKALDPDCLHADSQNKYSQLGIHAASDVHALGWYQKAAEQGDVYAAARLGDLYLHGNGIQHSGAEAFAWYNRAAQRGLPYAQYKLGNLYRDGIGTHKDLQLARKWYERAANGGCVHAASALAELYRGWHGGAINLNQAIYWYQRAAGLGCQDAVLQMSILMTEKPQHSLQFARGFSNLEDLAREGNSEASYALGNIYYEGRGVRQSYTRAISYYKQAADATPPQPDAQYKLARMYLTGRGTPIDAELGAKYMEAAANNCVILAQYNMGELYRRGEGVPASLKTASTWYARAVKNNNVPAMVRLADMHHSGLGADRYIPTAFALYKRAAERGNTYSQFMLSILLRTGHGIKEDLPASVKWYKSATQRPDALFAMYEIGKNYQLGYGLPEDTSEATIWYQHAANAGLPIAQTALADLYSNLVVPGTENYQLAVKWYLAAANQGYPYGEYGLGLLLLNNEINILDLDPNNTIDINDFEDEELALLERSNKRTAFVWFKKAAKQGYRPAQYQVASMYFKGEGIKQSDMKAYAWWQISLHRNYDSTPDFMTAIMSKMTPGERERAVQLAARYTDRYMLKAAVVNDAYPAPLGKSNVFARSVATKQSRSKKRGK